MAVNAQQTKDFEAAVRPHLAGELHLDVMTRGLYATDASMYEVMPVAVVVPRSADDVQLVLEAARRVRIPVLARGGGSSLAGQTVNEAVVVDFSKYLDRVIAFDAEAGTVRVEPGITHERLSNVIAAYGWMTGPDPASGSRATLGGMLANNATGTHSILYGNTIRHIESVRALLHDGTRVEWGAMGPDARRLAAFSSSTDGRLVAALDALARREGATIGRTMPPHWRRNNGYRVEELLGEEPNYARLLCGSEGTLAVVTDLTMNLVRRPKRTVVGVVHFATRTDSLESVTAILETDPSAVELFDGAAIRQSRESAGFAHRMTFVDGYPGAVLLTEYYVDSPAHGTERLDALQRAMDRFGRCTGIIRLEDPKDIANAWGVRKEGLGLIMSVRGHLKPLPFIEDASVPVENLAAYIDDLERVFADNGTEAVMYAHASAGCLHVRPLIDTRTHDGQARMVAIARGSADLVRRYGGWVSSEHGDGIARSWLNPGFLGPELYGICREVKRLFDPEGRLNPGRVIDAPPMTEHHRTGPDYRPIVVHTEFDFSVEGGFEAAVDLCNGNGACRRLEGGTMCPSFMATRDEKDSTRGRANALRLALAGRLEGQGLTDEGVKEVLDLCVQCKACKTECPSAVDMAKLKTEWLAQYWRMHDMPLRTRIFADLPVAARLLSGAPARLVNFGMGLAPVRWFLDRFLGISKRRALPPFSPRPYAPGASLLAGAMPTGGDGQAVEAPELVVASAPNGPVVLYVDTFNNHQHPEVARAAERFLRAAGWHVIPVANACCGRTWLSKGDIKRAKQEAERTVEILAPYAEAGLAIVGLEPSCVLTLGDEFRSMRPGDRRVDAIARASMTFEQFIQREAPLGRLGRLRWKPEAARVLVHGHCHQKALTGTAPSIACLSVVPGFRVEMIDAACCGMAGSFGYEKEHVDVSLAMAEDRLAPAIRKAGEDALLAAAGSSCRAQIHDVTGRTARHPAEILCAALDG